MKIIQPRDLSTTANISCLVYGPAGVGKTTLALSAPNPILIDLDHGLCRVQKEYQCPSIQVEKFEDILELLQSEELKTFGTIIIDTFGQFIECMFEYLANKNAKLKNYNGQPTQAGWGQIKTTCKKFLSDIFKINKNFICIAHEQGDKFAGDEIILRPEIIGSSGRELIKLVDLVGYMSIKGGKHTISFDPNDNFVAKNSLGLSGFIEWNNDNKFFSKIIDKISERREKDNLTRKEYDELLADQDSKLEKVGSPEDLELLMKELKDQETKIIWGSRIVFWNKIKKLAKDKFNMEYDNASERFMACNA